MDWYNELSRIIKIEEVLDEKDSEINKVVENNVFTVKKVTLKYNRAGRSYKTDTRKLQVSHMSIAEFLLQCYSNYLNIDA